MTVAEVEGGPVAGSVPAPPSKSYTHRALVAGFLTGKSYRVIGPLDADDTRATAAGLARLGARLDREPGVWTVEAPDSARARGPRTVQCRESGTTLRFLLPLAARSAATTTFVGSSQLARRPVAPLLDFLRAAGAEVDPAKERGTIVRVRGPIHPTDAPLDMSESSQYLSALALALPTLEGPSKVRLRGNAVSRPYFRATRAMLRVHGVRLRVTGSTVGVPAPQGFRASELRVPGDASSAAYLWTAGALSGGSVEVTGIDRRWPQADLAILAVLRASGVNVAARGHAVRVDGVPSVPIDVELDDAPDLMPLVAALAATVPGTSRLRGGAHAARKESDRRRRSEQLARALGATTRRSSDLLEIEGSRHRGPFRFEGGGDHRLVMSAAVAALGRSGTSRIRGAEDVRKSFPGFWTALRRLGASVRSRP